MLAALALLALHQISGDPMVAFLDRRLPLANSPRALRISLNQWFGVADYMFDAYVFRPAGMNVWVFPLMPGNEMDGGTIALAKPEGKTYHLESLMPLGNFMPSSGFRDGRNLVLAGLDGWMGNGPSAEAVVLRKVSGRWKVTQRSSSPFQSEECRFVRRGSSWIAAIEGRTYPKNLNVSHAMAQVGMRQRFVYSAGVLRAERATRTMNPMAVLDDLAGAAQRGDLASVRKNCGSAAVAQRVYALGSKLKDSNWDIPGNVCSTANSVYISDDLRLRFEFKRSGGRWILSRLKPAGP